MTTLRMRVLMEPRHGARYEEIRALDVPSWKRTILRAMARYGIFAGDTGGSPWDLEFESSSTYTSFGRPDPLVAIARDAEHVAEQLLGGARMDRLEGAAVR